MTPALAGEVAALLSRGSLPKLPLSGQGGAGEILWAGPLFAELAEGFQLGEKDALSLVNGSPAASALIADAALAMRRRLDLAERIFARGRGNQAPLEAHDAVFESCGRSHEADGVSTTLSCAMAALTGGLPSAGQLSDPPAGDRLVSPRDRAGRGIAESSLQSVTDNPCF